MPEKFTYIVGDIHGCVDEMHDLETLCTDHATRNGAKALFVSVGDLIDRGPGSKEVLLHYFNGSKNGTHACILGNHEQEFLVNLFSFNQKLYNELNVPKPHHFLTHSESHEGGEWLATHLNYADYSTTCRSLWIGQGGIKTLESFRFDPNLPETWNIAPDLLNWIATLPLWLEGDNWIATHGLISLPDWNQLQYTPQLHSESASDQNEIEIKIWRKAIRGALWNRDAQQDRLDPHKFHISGHTPMDKVKRGVRNGRIQIDTGAVYGGKLTAWCAATNSLHAVKAATHWI